MTLRYDEGKVLPFLRSLAAADPCRSHRMQSGQSRAQPMRDKSDVLVHYDEEQQRFIFYTVKSEDTAALRAKAFDGVSPAVAAFKEQPSEEAERMLGGMIFSLLDLGAIRKVMIRDYEAQSRATIDQWVAQWEVDAAKGDPEAQYSLYMELHSRAVKSGQLGDLQRAEELLFASARAGYADAQEALEDWPILKGALERRIKRDRSG
jgi:hypothetical protein